jgi:rSAM/selenodomain-associated transferase 2
MRVSVIIPVLNEESTIGEALRRLATDQHPDEIIVVDGGSQDQTLNVVAHSAVHPKLILGSRGRARQMNAGARQATGDILVFLHSDSELPPGELDKIRAIVGTNKALGGKFRLKFRPDNLRLKIYASYTRFQFFSYGDQAFFVRKDLFESLGGYREDVPFEDIDFYTRLRKRTKPAIIKDPVITSSRRFQRVGVAKQKWINFLLVSLYYLGWKVGPWKAKWYQDVRGQ